jgi:hypothetical protein
MLNEKVKQIHTSAFEFPAAGNYSNLFLECIADWQENNYNQLVYKIVHYDNQTEDEKYFLVSFSDADPDDVNNLFSYIQLNAIR